MSTKKRKKGKRKSNKGFLVKGYIPPVSRGLLEFEYFKNEIKDMLRNNSGVYVLYKGNNLYYVGLASDLYWRLYRHTKDKHKNHWDKFSVFIIGKGRYLKDIEAMVHRISEPPANIWKGKFKEHYEYDKRIKKMAKDTFNIIKKIQQSK